MKYAGRALPDTKHSGGHSPPHVAEHWRSSRKWHPALLVVRIVALAAVLGGVSVALAEAPRLRSLKYDPKQKQWAERAFPTPGTAEGDLYVAKTMVREGRQRAALSKIKQFVKKYGQKDALYPEALIFQAEALIGMKDFDKAHEVLQAFLSEFAGAALTEEALRLEFVVAEAYLGGAKRTVWKIFRVSGVETGYQILDEIATDHRDTRFAELAIKTKADHLFRVGEHALAELEYARLLREHSGTGYHQYALRRSADSALASFGGVEFDEAALVEAQERFNDYRAKYPTDAAQEGVGQVVQTIDEMRADKEFRIGQYYDRTGHLGAAVFYYQAVGKGFPDSIAAGKAEQRLRMLGAAQPVASAGTTETR